MNETKRESKRRKRWRWVKDTFSGEVECLECHGTWFVDQPRRGYRRKRGSFVCPFCREETQYAGLTRIRQVP